MINLAQTYFIEVMTIILYCLLIFVPLLLGVVMALYADRKIWAAVQKRRGPNVVGPYGLFQVPADGLKFIFKEIILPDGSDKIVFLIAPIITLALSIAAWAVVPVQAGVVLANINVGILYIFAISSLGVYGILMAGWSSNSKYPFFGALRSAAQMVSYEVSIGFVIITVLLCVGSLNLTEIVMAQKTMWFFIPLFPMFIVFFISALAETNRPPFDLPEAESELVAGYQTEYSGMPFVLFMFGEYINILLMCAMTTILFLGGWLPPIDIYPLNAVPGFVWFLLTWTLGGLWVLVTLCAALAAITSSNKLDLGVLGILGIVLWCLGFVIEVIADHQKTQFRKVPENKDRFISNGLWSWSQHPNYFGEILLWLGVAFIAFPVLSGIQMLTLISPVFVYFLLTKVSGIPLLDRLANNKWGDDADYQKYIRSTSKLVLLPPK